MNPKSSDGLCKVSLLPCTKGKVIALISPVLRGQYSSLQGSWSIGSNSCWGLWSGTFGFMQEKYQD